MSCRALDFLSQCHCLQSMFGLNIKNMNLKLSIVEFHITGTYQDVEEDVTVSGTFLGAFSYNLLHVILLKNGHKRLTLALKTSLL